MRSKLAVAVLTGISVIGSSAVAQNVLPVTILGQPLVYMKAGELEGCGVRFIIVDAPPPNAKAVKTVPVWDASFNVYVSGNAAVKVGSQDVSLADVRTGRFSGTGKPVTPATFWLKANDAPATKPMSPMARGDDPGNVLFLADMDAVIPLFLASLRQEAILVGTQRPGARTERIFTGTIQMAPEEFDRVRQCLLELEKRPTSK